MKNSSKIFSKMLVKKIKQVYLVEFMSALLATNQLGGETITQQSLTYCQLQTNHL